MEPIYPKALTFMLIAVFTFYVGNLYDLSLHMRKRELLLRIASCFLVIALIVASIGFLIPFLQLSRGAYLFSIAFSLFVVTGFRFFYYWVLHTKTMTEKVLILGHGRIAWLLSAELQSGNNPGFELLGFIAENGTDQHAEFSEFRKAGQSQKSEEELYSTKAPSQLTILGTIKDLEYIASGVHPDVLVVALSERRGALPIKEILDCKMQGIRVEDWPTFYEKLTGKIFIQNLRPSWLIFSEGFARNNLTRTTKRMVDLLLSIFGLITSFPLMLFLALLIKLDSAGPIFLRQERMGENGKVFILYKFRTMITDAEKETGPVWAQTIDPRTTRVGKILRRIGLDELPQLFNVLKGNMSFVGPRPERPHFIADLQEKIPYYSQRLVVKPGITGWAQVRYGYGASLEDAIEKLQYDLYYIKNMSLFLDMLIILSTIHKVVFGKVAVQSAKLQHQTAAIASQPLLKP
jgi:sugar transferase (PEP-CTERM system associated)